MIASLIPEPFRSELAHAGADAGNIHRSGAAYAKVAEKVDQITARLQAHYPNGFRADGDKLWHVSELINANTI